MSVTQATLIPERERMNHSCLAPNHLKHLSISLCPMLEQALPQTTVWPLCPEALGTEVDCTVGKKRKKVISTHIHYDDCYQKKKR